MNSLVIFAVVLAVAGGVIAHFGDRLGTYVGKKRISLIGLRPRHTAMLYTIVSGSLIAVLTLGVLVLSDYNVRRAVLEGPRLISENQHYRKQIKAEQAQAHVEQLRARAASDALAAANAKFRPVKQKLKGVQDQLSRSQLMLMRRQSQLALAQKQLGQVRATLSGANVSLRLADREVSRAKRSLDVAQSNVRAANDRVVAERKNVNDLESTGKNLLEANGALADTNNKLKIQSKLLAGRVIASSENMIFPKDQELDRLVIKTTQPVSVIEMTIESFLQHLSEVAQNKGGKLGVNGRAVVIAVPSSADVYRPLTLVQETEAINALAQNIAAEPSGIASVVLIARAATNTFVGEQTGIYLHAYENLLIYHKDAVVAKGIINGAQSAIQIIDALTGFLTDKVRRAVTRQGLILQRNASGQSTVGSALDEATANSLVQQISRLGGSADVTAYASEDIYSSGPVHLRFTVAPIGPAAAPRSSDKVRNRS